MTPPVAPVVGELAAAKVEKVKNNAFRLAVTCDSDVACTGKLKVRSVGKVTLANGKTRTLVLAKSSYSVKPGKKATVKLTLTKPARKVLGSKRLRVEAVQTAPRRRADEHEVLVAPEVISMSARARRAAASFAVLAAGLVGGGVALGLVPAAVLPAASAATCTSAGGVSVVVDFRELGGSVVTACAEDGGGKSATAIFDSVGVAMSYSQPSARVRLPLESRQRAVLTPRPADAYWGLWWSDGTAASWTYSSYGVGSLTVPAGGSVALVLEAGDRERRAARGRSAGCPQHSDRLADVLGDHLSDVHADPLAHLVADQRQQRQQGRQRRKARKGDSSNGSSPSATPSASPSSSAPSEPSESPLAIESPGDSTASESGKGSDKGATEGSRKSRKDPSRDPESPGDSPSSADPESPADSASGASSEAGSPSADEPARVPAAVTWGVVGLLAIAIAVSAVVARRRRGA